MEEMELGPNGGLIFCMELLLENKGNVINKKGLSCRTQRSTDRKVGPSGPWIPGRTSPAFPGSCQKPQLGFLIRAEFLPNFIWPITFLKTETSYKLTVFRIVFLIVSQKNTDFLRKWPVT